MTNHSVNWQLYIAGLPLNSHEKSILSQIASMRLSHNIAHPGYKRFAIWISRGARTVGRALARLKKDGWITVKRRGKKLTNVYYLSQYLWRLLMRGRRWVPKRVERQTSERAYGNVQGSLFELFQQEIKRAASG